MKKIEHTYNIKEMIKYPELFSRYSKDGDTYLTIETTGLSPERHRIISISVGTISDDIIGITTFFSDNKDDELTIIEKGLDSLENSGRVITWNGDSFDFRFLSRRGEEYGKKIPAITSYDLRRILSPLKRLLPDGSFSLYELLEKMDITDSSIPDSRTLVTLYKTYIETGADRYSAPIEKHSIYKLTGIMNLMCLQNCLKLNKASPVIEDISATNEALNVKGTTDLFFPIEITVSLPGIRINFSKNSFSGSFTTYDGRIRMYFPDPSSYVRLKADGSLIPKELSKSMSRSDYESVTKENCFSLVKIPREKKQLENYIRSLEKM